MALGTCCYSVLGAGEDEGHEGSTSCLEILDLILQTRRHVDFRRVAACPKKKKKKDSAAAFNCILI